MEDKKIIFIESSSSDEKHSATRACDSTRYPSGSKTSESTEAGQPDQAAVSTRPSMERERSMGQPRYSGNHTQRYCQV